MSDLKRSKITPVHIEEAARLKALWNDGRPRRTQAEFGEHYGLGNQANVGHYLNGRSPLNLRAAMAFGRELKCDVADFSPRLAEEGLRLSYIDEEDGLPSIAVPWGRRPHFATSPNTDPVPELSANTEPGPDIRGKVPLISWVRAGELCESHDNFHPGDAEHWMDCPVAHGPRTYCLEISGDSMDDGGADAYRDGEIIFVDPDASPNPGRDVVVRTPDNKTTFKRLKEDTEGRYLLGLNGKKIIRVPEGTEFCGVVIFSGRRR